MANFLLVHGAWHGAWYWRFVSEALIRAGHRAHAVTLTGVGERAHLLHRNITLETHINDVIAALEAEELENAVLVVHSYAGMLGTAVADRMGQRLGHLVYADAVVPKPGESWSSTHAAATRNARMAAAAADPDFSFPAPDPSVFGLQEQDADWVRRRQTALETLPAGALIRTRVVDPKFWSGAWLPGSRVVTLTTGHDPMISAPAELTQILLDCALA